MAPSLDVLADTPTLSAGEKQNDGVLRIDDAELWRMQIDREQRSQAEACDKYCKVENDFPRHRFQFLGRETVYPWPWTSAAYLIPRGGLSTYELRSPTVICMV